MVPKDYLSGFLGPTQNGETEAIPHYIETTANIWDNKKGDYGE